MRSVINTALLFLLYSVGQAQIVKKPIPDKLVVLTFDDAVKTHSTVVAPLLKQFGFGATFFVCEFPPNYSDTSKYMTWREMQQLDKMGFEVANHTATHKHVNKLSKQAFIKELEYIEHKCDSLKMQKPVTFAYPAYDTHPMATETLLEKGYWFARTGGDCPYNPHVNHPYLVPGYTTTKTNRKEILQALQKAKDGNIIVLTFHGVPDYEHDWVTTPPELFKEYLQYLHKNKYKVIALKDLSEYINVRQALKEIKPDYSLKNK
jgi:peptidoglycan/xylan/chitin deacetylase (PgdA/CDA1 family)